MKLKSGLLLAAAVGVVGLLAGYWYFENLRVDEAQNVALARTEATPAPKTAQQVPDPAPVVAAPSTDAAAAADAGTPGFDIIRVEPDGTALIAGRAAPDTLVRIMDGTQELATATTNAQGEFVLTLEKPLPVGDHEIALATGEGDSQVVSAQRVVVSVPMPGRESELLVMLEEPDKPSQIIATPQADGNAPAAAGPTDMAAAQTGQPDAPEKEPRVGAAQADPDAPSIGAVEIEGDQLYIAGTAAKGSRVRLYLNDEFVAEAPIGDKREFLANTAHAVPVGQHVVRADVVDRNGNVVARAEVPFARPDGEHVAAVAASPALPGMSAAEKADPTLAQDGSAGEGALEPADGRVIIRKGDTLWRISRENYGLGSRYTVIYLANGDQIRNPDLIYPGQIFRMPTQQEPAPAGG